jgi:hypothetical protein
MGYYYRVTVICAERHIHATFDVFASNQYQARNKAILKFTPGVFNGAHIDFKVEKLLSFPEPISFTIAELEA